MSGVAVEDHASPSGMKKKGNSLADALVVTVDADVARSAGRNHDHVIGPLASSSVHDGNE